MEYEFKPKEWVLVRDDVVENWKLDIFSHLVDGASFPYICIGGCYSECIPFEGNEALIGTTDAPKEKHVWHAGDRVDVLSAFDDMWHLGFIVEIDYTRSGSGFYYRVESECFKSIVNHGKVWCKADQLRKPEEKPKEEKLKFGDWVEVLEDGEWTVGIVTEVDEDDEFATYHVNFPEDEGWYSKSEVRKHEKG